MEVFFGNVFAFLNVHKLFPDDPEIVDARSVGWHLTGLDLGSHELAVFFQLHIESLGRIENYL